MLCPPRAEQDPTFRAWFGNSQAVDAHGKPLLVYHGTETLFEAFDPLRIRRSSRPAFWFASHRACGYYGHHRLPVYLRTPRVLEAPDGWLTHWVQHAIQANLEAALDDEEDPVWDAVVFRDVVDGDTPSDVWAVFEPTSIRTLWSFAQPGGIIPAGVG